MGTTAKQKKQIEKALKLLIQAQELLQSVENEVGYNPSLSDSIAHTGRAVNQTKYL